MESEMTMRSAARKLARACEPLLNEADRRLRIARELGRVPNLSELKGPDGRPVFLSNAELRKIVEGCHAVSAIFDAERAAMLADPRPEGSETK